MMRLSAPKGSHYSITAGKRSAPAGGVRPQDGPQGGPTVVRRCGCACIGRLGRLVRGVVRPLWGRECEGVVCGPRVRFAHPRLQISSALVGPHASLRFGVCHTAGLHASPRFVAGRTAEPHDFLRFVAGHTAEPHISLRFVVGRIAGPHASLRFGVCRTAELHDFLRFGAGCPAAELMMRQSAPQGSHYSITAGKRSAPAGGMCIQVGPQGGPTVVWRCGRARIGCWERLVRGVVRPLWSRDREG